MIITQIPWIEIPVNEFQRALKFYEKVLEFKFSHHNFEGRRHAIAKINDLLTLSLVERKEKILIGAGPVLFLKVEGDMGLILEKIEKEGGKIVQSKTLIRNNNQNGTTTIAKTLIDHKSGYYSLFSDSENHLFALYSNS